MEDPGIKLFGKNILLPEISKTINPPVIPTTAGEESTGGCDDSGGCSDSHSCIDGERVVKEVAEKDQLKARSSPKAMVEMDNPKTPSINEETRTGESEHEASNTKHKTLKKPDKILPCPRCNSMDTKFCYYNNYNVNQPRHFCKSCQRYWTAGGAMRNMPVGAGRRKSKNSASLCRYITISQETFQTAAVTQVEASTTPKVTASDSENTQDKNGLNPKVHTISGVSWPYNPWSSTIPIPAICPPIPVYPSTYWTCIPFLPPSTPAQTKTSYPCDPILGKHSRDDVLVQPNDSDDHLKKPKNSVLIPKTLRIDDPNEAAKSSIWATLGIKNENFKAFQEKGDPKKKNQVTTTSPVLQANPAALSRSLCFQETV